MTAALNLCYCRGMNMQSILLATVTAALTVTAGCSSLTQVRFTVQSSSLDYVQFRSTRPSSSGGAPSVVKLELAGSGYLEYISGRSERVRDAFWQESAAPNWQDIRTDHVVLTQDETVVIYQRLVDAGVFDNVRRQQTDAASAHLAVLASIRFRKKLVLTSDPVYLDIFSELLARFER